MLKYLMAVAIVLGGSSYAQSQCVNGVCDLPDRGHVAVVAPIRSVMRAAVVAPVRVVQAVAPSRIVGCGGVPVASCAGPRLEVYRRAPIRTRLYNRRPVVAVGCGGAVAAPVAEPSCCGPTLAPDVSLGAVGPVSYATGGGSLYSIALASAQYRAANGIHGHCSIEMGRTAGVGWSTHNSRPMTCLGNSDPSYAVVRGRDGFYATVVR